MISAQVRRLCLFLVLINVSIQSVSSRLKLPSNLADLKSTGDGNEEEVHKNESLPKDEEKFSLSRNRNYNFEKEKLRSLLAREVILDRNLRSRFVDDEHSSLIVGNLVDHESVDYNFFPLEDADDEKYLNEWLVDISGGEGVARKLVEELNYNFVKPISEFSDIYLISHKMAHHNSKREARNITRHINSHIEVHWAEQQVARQRDKRSSIGNEKVIEAENINNRIEQTIANVIQNRKYANMFNDELWSHQWYIFDSRIRSDLPELDLKVIPVWNSGITGKGIRVLIIDDGIEWTHDDLKNSYDPDISYDLNDDDADPSPRIDAEVKNSHGTKCAGEIVMQPNNSKCGVGIAYGARIGGIRILDGDITDRLEGTSLALYVNDVDIISCSWVPIDDGTRVEGPGRLAQLALKLGITEGRNGKGIIYVWASGNGGIHKDNCNCDGYASSIFTISIGSASERGESTWYGEHCTSVLAATYSSGGYSDQMISTTDVENTCTMNFAGTSASSPLAAGVIALALEANGNLTWRDVQHAVVLTSNWETLALDLGWKINARGLYFNSKLGFGLLNADKLVSIVRKWKPVPDKTIETIDADISSVTKIKSGTVQTVEIETNFKPEKSIIFLEHVEVVVTLKHSKRGAIKITIISPLGTSTDVLTPRTKDKSKKGFKNWAFMSVHTWGEDPNGIWKVIIEDTSQTGELGTLTKLSLVLHGTSVVPEMFKDQH